MTGRPRNSTLFPYTTLSRSERVAALAEPPLRSADVGAQVEHALDLAVGPPSVERPEVGAVAEEPQRAVGAPDRSEEHTSELQSRQYLVCRLLLEKKKHNNNS